jgi:predicted RNA-binding protein
MCESNVYTKDGSLIMEEAILVEIEENKIDMMDILNNKKTIYGKIVKIDFESHKLYVEENKNQ